MKTKIFKLDRLSKKDLQTLEQWRESLRWVWNTGLDLLIEFDTFTTPYRHVEIETEAITNEDITKKKEDWRRAPCCPLPWQYRRIDKDRPWEPGNLVAYTYFARKKPYAMFCPITPNPLDWQEGWEVTSVNSREQKWLEDCGYEPLSTVSDGKLTTKTYRIIPPAGAFSQYTWREPRLDSASNFSLCKYFAHKRHPDKPWLKVIPSVFIRGTCASLAEAWQRYKSGKAKHPKFKRMGDATDTLINNDAKSISVEPINDRDGLIRIPKLGVFRVKYLWRDWGDCPIRTLKVARKPDGWYLQLTGILPVKPEPKRDRPAATVTFPLRDNVLAQVSSGEHLKSYLKPDEDVAIARRLEKLQQKLSRQVYLSKNWRKTKKKIARLHDRRVRAGANLNQKISTFITRTYGELDVQKPQKIALKQPAKKMRKGTLNPIHFEPNGAEVVAELNKQRLGYRAGQLVALIKQKRRVPNV
ncbi:MAG: transposase [Cyanobacteriota bacterium]